MGGGEARVSISITKNPNLFCFVCVGGGEGGLE